MYAVQRIAGTLPRPDWLAPRSVATSPAARSGTESGRWSPGHSPERRPRTSLTYSGRISAGRPSRLPETARTTGRRRRAQDDHVVDGLQDGAVALALTSSQLQVRCCEHADGLRPLDGARERDARAAAAASLQSGHDPPDPHLRPPPPASARRVPRAECRLGRPHRRDPLLAGRVVDALVDGGAQSTVIVLAGLIALIAVLDAVVGIAERWQSARIGKGSSSTCAGPCSLTSSGCRWRSSPAPARVPW